MIDEKIKKIESYLKGLNGAELKTASQETAISCYEETLSDLREIKKREDEITDALEWALKELQFHSTEDTSPSYLARNVDRGVIDKIKKALS